MNVNEINDKMTQPVIEVIEIEKARMLHDVSVALINKSSCYPYAKDIAKDARFIVDECFRKEEQQ